MISFLKHAWNTFGQSEERRKELQELFEFESNYLDNIVSKEQENEILSTGSGNKEPIKIIKETECCQRRGTVTRLDSNNGLIDGTIFFDIKVSSHLTSELKVGSQIDYLLYRNPRTDHLTVVKILGIIDQYWDIQDEGVTDNKEEKSENPSAVEYFSTSRRNILGMVIGVIPKGIIVETEYKTLDIDMNTVECDFKPNEGDRVYLASKVQNDEGYVDRHGEILEVFGVFAARILKNEKCTVNAVNHDWGILNENCYIKFDNPEDIPLNVGDIISADIIECERGKFNWRCIKYTMIQKAGEANEATENSEKTFQKERFVVTVSEDKTCIFGGLDQTQTVDMIVTNNCSHTMIALGISLRNRNPRNAVISLIDSNDENGFEVPSKGTYVLKFSVKSKYLGESHESFIVRFGSFSIKRSIIVNVCEDEETAEKLRTKNAQNFSRNHATTIVNAARNMRSRHYANEVWSKEQPIIPGVGLLKKRRFIARHIPSFEVPQRLRNAYLTNDRKTYITDHIENMYPCLREELSYKNYVQRFQTLIHLEEIDYFVNFRKYDRERANFRHEGEYLALIIENLAEKRPSLVVGDVVRAINPFTENSSVYEGFIHKVLGDKVLIKFNASFHSMYRNEDYRLEFFFSRFTFRKCHYAVERIVKHLGEKFLFPTEVTKRKWPQLNIEIDDNFNMSLKQKQLKWFNEKLNEFQRLAVYNVLRGEVFHMPYVIFGPPGTGKTMTIVETILQLLKNVDSSRIIVATPSNSSANLIATRLIDSGEVCPGDFVRLVSQTSIEQDLIPEHLMPYCATVDVGMDGTCKDEMTITESGLKLRCQMKYLGRHKITVGTCATLGNYMLLNFPPDHFSHVLIDEAGQCLEPEIMIAISQVTRFRGQIVLAGDPHQLQPIVINRYAEELGYTVSFLERILDRAPYRKDNKRFPKSNGCDPCLVTKLLYNYRSLQSILKPYNDFFYHSELIPVVNDHSSREADILKKLHQSGLFRESNKRSICHGTFFHGTRSENAQDKDSPSWFNKLEAANVFLWTIKLYRRNISFKDIGIITPYARQVKYIRNMFITANVEIPKIGTVEEFQGQERDVILISTVRSSSSQIQNDLKYSLGFVRCKKRMNVAISRARCLMIVFGNPHLLYQDPYWHKFIKYCVSNDAYEGCDLPEGFDTMVENPSTLKETD